MCSDTIFIVARMYRNNILLYSYDRYVAPNIIQTSVNSGVVSFYITDRVVY